MLLLNGYPYHRQAGRLGAVGGDDDTGRVAHMIGAANARRVYALATSCTS